MRRALRGVLAHFRVLQICRVTIPNKGCLILKSRQVSQIVSEAIERKDQLSNRLHIWR